MWITLQSKLRNWRVSITSSRMMPKRESKRSKEKRQKIKNIIDKLYEIYDKKYEKDTQRLAPRFNMNSTLSTLWPWSFHTKAISGAVTIVNASLQARSKYHILHNAHRFDASSGAEQRDTLHGLSLMAAHFISLLRMLLKPQGKKNEIWNQSKGLKKVN